MAVCEAFSDKDLQRIGPAGFLYDIDKLGGASIRSSRSILSDVQKKNPGEARIKVEQVKSERE